MKVGKRVEAELIAKSAVIDNDNREKIGDLFTLCISRETPKSWKVYGCRRVTFVIIQRTSLFVWWWWP